MILVTGGAGFIGYNIVRRLNLMGHQNIIISDELNYKSAEINLKKLKFIDYIKPKDVFSYENLQDLSVLFHQGACSDTMEYDKQKMIEKNYEYSKKIFELAKLQNARFVYASSASVYGLSQDSKEISSNESPLNVYAESKLAFDNFIRNEDYPAVGLRYFNVYGPGEENKGKMASMPYKMINQYLADKEISLFKGFNGYADGGQKRDFISVEDVVSINMFFMENNISGIFNVGTGVARSFNDIALNIIGSNNKNEFSKVIKYFDMPEFLKDKYQNFTQANINSLRASGYNYDFFTLEEGVKNYLRYVMTSSS